MVSTPEIISKCKVQNNKGVRCIGDTVNYKRYRCALHFDITTSPKGVGKVKGVNPESWN